MKRNLLSIRRRKKARNNKKLVKLKKGNMNKRTNLKSKGRCFLTFRR